MPPPASVDIHAHHVPERFFTIIEEAGQPFDMGYTRPVDVVQRLRLNRADQRRILGATAARLLRLG